ncbi:MAG: hypothetical protein LBI43_06750 [Streptococcaceae bacterium]|jgi:hypothetical protein|nr:hypothetical protein [Streptococcaceae bacterium]
MTEKNNFSYEVLEEIATLDEDLKGWKRKLCRISYNGQEPVYDFRVWSPQGKFGKGFTLREEPFQKLVEILKERY